MESNMQGNKPTDIEIVTVYQCKVATTYLLSEYLKDPETATVLKTQGYERPPVIKFEEARHEQANN